MSEGGEDAGRAPHEATLPRRDQVMDALCEAYARDELGMEELERRLDVAARASTASELLGLVSDLDGRHLPVALGGEVRGGTGHAAPAASRTAGGAGSELRVPPGVGRTDPARVPERQFEVAVFSGRSRKGSWTPARQITAMSCMGGVELDFREALFGGGTIDVYAVALMGSVEILVPPGVQVDTAGLALLGAFEEDSTLESGQAPGGPVVRVRGFACLGSVEIVVRYPGESSRDAKRRVKEERRRLRESQRRSLGPGG